MAFLFPAHCKSAAGKRIFTTTLEGSLCSSEKPGISEGLLGSRIKYNYVLALVENSALADKLTSLLDGYEAPDPETKLHVYLGEGVASESWLVLEVSTES